MTKRTLKISQCEHRKIFKVRFAIFIMYERVLIYRTYTWSFFNHDVIFLFVSRTKAGATAN